MSDKYELMKVFDCQDMPEDVRKCFFEKCGSPSFNHGNDCCVEWHAFNTGIFKKELKEDDIIVGEVKSTGDGFSDVFFRRGDNIVDDWLHDNGLGFECMKPVIIKHWW